MQGIDSSWSHAQWKALKCQTLGAAVHVIVHVCWVITVSWLSHTCHAHSVLLLPCKVRSQISDALSQPLCNFSFPSWFHTIWFYCSHTFIAFSRKLHSAFVWIERHHYSVYMSSVLKAQQLYTANIPLLEAYLLPEWSIIELAMNVSPENKTAASHVVQIHTHVRFPRSKNGRLIM